MHMLDFSHCRRPDSPQLHCPSAWPQLRHASALVWGMLCCMPSGHLLSPHQEWLREIGMLVLEKHSNPAIMGDKMAIMCRATAGYKIVIITQIACMSPSPCFTAGSGNPINQHQVLVPGITFVPILVSVPCFGICNCHLGTQLRVLHPAHQARIVPEHQDIILQMI